MEQGKSQVKRLAGSVGALLGALIGGACIVAESRLGYVSIVSGVVMVFCTTKAKHDPARQSAEDVLANVRHRDHIDMTRAESPLRRADDAVDLDNSHMTVQEQDEWLLARFRKAAED